jgi:hypothetical protein
MSVAGSGSARTGHISMEQNKLDAYMRCSQYRGAL